MSEMNQIFREFAVAFAGALDNAKPICFRERLDCESLDLSLDSLKSVDRYLAYLHKHKKKLDDEEWQSTVLYCGAYIGEVIRNETDNAYNWIDYDDYIPNNPELQKLIPQRSVATCAFIVNDDGKMMMPMNKVARFIDEGVENSVHYFAKVCMVDDEDA